MPKMTVTYYDTEGAEMEILINADDEAAALGYVLDEHGDTIGAASPFAVWRESSPRCKAKGARKGDKAKPIGVPQPTGAHLDDEDDELVVETLPEGATATTLKELGDKLGVQLEGQV